MANDYSRIDNDSHTNWGEFLPRLETKLSFRKFETMLKEAEEDAVRERSEREPLGLPFERFHAEKLQYSDSDAISYPVMLVFAEHFFKRLEQRTGMSEKEGVEAVRRILEPAMSRVMENAVFWEDGTLTAATVYESTAVVKKDEPIIPIFTSGLGYIYVRTCIRTETLSKLNRRTEIVE